MKTRKVKVLKSEVHEYIQSCKVDGVNIVSANQTNPRFTTFELECSDTAADSIEAHAKAVLQVRDTLTLIERHVTRRNELNHQHWGHVGDMNEIETKLSEVLRFISTIPIRSRGCEVMPAVEIMCCVCGDRPSIDGDDLCQQCFDSDGNIDG